MEKQQEKNAESKAQNTSEKTGTAYDVKRLNGAVSGILETKLLNDEEKETLKRLLNKVKQNYLDQ